MRYKRLSLTEAEKIITQYDNMNDAEFTNIIEHWKAYDIIETPSSTYEDFRTKLLNAFKEALSETGGEMTYFLDLKVGLCLYQLMPLGKDFSIIDANDDDIWRYISVKVMPDITYLRYPNPAKGDIRINSKRFYRGKRRIWLKTLWWYVHLSWQGNEDKTFNVLKNNATDNINKLIETPGKGYRLTLYRNMVREYSEHLPHTAKNFAAMTKLNNAKCTSVEPELIAGGEKQYVKQLISEVVREEESDES